MILLRIKHSKLLKSINYRKSKGAIIFDSSKSKFKLDNGNIELEILEKTISQLIISESIIVKKHHKQRPLKKLKSTLGTVVLFPLTLIPAGGLIMTKTKKNNLPLDMKC